MILFVGEDITNNMEMYLRYPAAETRRRRHAELTRMYNRNKRQTMSTSNNIDWGDGDDEDLSVCILSPYQLS